MEVNDVQAYPFGFLFDLLNFDDKSKNVRYLPENPILNGPMGKVTELQFFAGTSMTLYPEDNSSVKGLIYRSGSSFGNRNVMFVSAEYGKGKVVAMGDSSPADDGSGDRNDRLYDGWLKDANGNHERLIVNATLWLAGTVTGVQSPTEKKEMVPVFFQKRNGNCEVQVGTLPARTKKAYFSVYDLSGRKLAGFRAVTSGQRLSLNLGPGHGVFVYRLHGAGFSQTGKFMY